MKLPICVKSSFLFFVPALGHIAAGSLAFGMTTAALGCVSVMNHAGVGGKTIQHVDRVMAHAVPAMYCLCFPTALTLGTTTYCGSLFMYGKHVRRKKYPEFQLCDSVFHAHLHALAALAMAAAAVC